MLGGGWFNGRIQGFHDQPMVDRVCHGPSGIGGVGQEENTERGNLLEIGQVNHRAAFGSFAELVANPKWHLIHEI
jgi:hypothetical protein